MVSFNTRIEDILEGFPFKNHHFGVQKKPAVNGRY